VRRGESLTWPGVTGPKTSIPREIPISAPARTGQIQSSPRPKSAGHAARYDEAGDEVAGG
jgi:hypothetical protein